MALSDDLTLAVTAAKAMETKVGGLESDLTAALTAISKLEADLAAALARIAVLEAGTPPPPPPPPPPEEPVGYVVHKIGTGTKLLVVKMAQDAYQGDCTFSVKVDNVQIGGTLTAKALASTANRDVVEISGNWADGSHTCAITLLNDYYGGTPTTDRNLYFYSATIDGKSVFTTPINLFGGAPATFSFQVGTGTGTPPPVEPVPTNPGAMPPPPAFASGFNQIFLENWSNGLVLRSNPLGNPNANANPTSDSAYPDDGYRQGTGLWSPHLKWPNAAIVTEHGEPAYANLHHPLIKQHVPDVLRVENGELVSRLQKVPSALSPLLPLDPSTNAPYKYITAQISSRWAFYCKFGFLEVCAWIRPAQGMLCASLWTLPQFGNWPPEIDVDETVGGDHHVTIHTNGSPSRNVNAKHNLPAGGGYIRYGTHWQPGRMTNYMAQGLDGPWQMIGEITDHNAADCDVSHYLISGMGSHTAWAGPVNEAQLPFMMRVKYIRVLQAPGGVFYNARGPHAPI
jgi:hypothetical protein